MATQSSYSVFDEFIDPLVASMSPEAAERILKAGISPQFQAHIDQLADKASRGTLTTDEEAEYRDIVEVADLVTVFKLKLRHAFGR
jgi:hypothetical protein